MAAYENRRKPCIERRWNTYHVSLTVPADVQAKIGKRRLTRSLKTDSLSEAERRAQPYLTAWRRQIAEARGELYQAPDNAAFFRQALRNAKSEAEREAIRDVAWGEAYDEGIAHAELDQNPTDVPEAASFYARATSIGFGDLVDEWLGTSSATAKTKAMQAADVRRFAVQFGTVPEVRRAAVKRWADALMADPDPAKRLTGKTVRRILSALRGYWRHLQSVEIVPTRGEPEIAEPFSALNIASKGGRAKRDDKWQPFKPADVSRLMAEARKRGDAELVDLIDIGRWSGARIEELCSLEIERVHLSGSRPYFEVDEGKTGAALRQVPIHRNAMATFKRLIGKRKSGFVFEGLKPNKYGDRSNAVGKRFGRLKTAMGFGDPFVYHSLRKCVSTQLENAGIGENITADIIGHDKPRMTYGIYSGGASLTVKTAALSKLRYPAA
jgi:integrase